MNQRTYLAINHVPQGHAPHWLSDQDQVQTPPTVILGFSVGLLDAADLLDVRVLQSLQEDDETLLLQGQVNGTCGGLRSLGEGEWERRTEETEIAEGNSYSLCTILTTSFVS